MDDQIARNVEALTRRSRAHASMLSDAVKREEEYKRKSALAQRSRFEAVLNHHEFNYAVICLKQALRKHYNNEEGSIGAADGSIDAVFNRIRRLALGIL